MIIIPPTVPCDFRSAARRQLHLSDPAFQPTFRSRETSDIGLARAQAIRRSVMTIFHNVGVSYMIALGALALIISVL